MRGYSRNGKTVFSILMMSTMGAALMAPMVYAHDDHCSAVQESVSAAGFSDRVDVSCNDSNAIVQSDTYLDHELLT